MNAPSEAEEALAQGLVEETLEGLAARLSAAEQLALREELLAHLLGTPEGRLKLRQLADEPVVQRSGDVAKGDAVVVPLRKKGVAT